MKKKAFTLIELVIAVSIASILFSLEIRVLAREIRSFSRNLQCTVNYSSINEGINFIHKVLHGKSDIQVQDNTIKVVDNKKNKIKTIKLEKGVLKIEYEDVNYHSGKKTFNTICKDVKNFNVYKNAKVLFVKIQDITGKECSRFIPLEN
ncbi:type II secretion system protein [Haloimpatiens lingqiaonensis]|uniref:type II secretion system protein n=1 Tax=Haloimpatiens lingqiaonensis TaxID=1380675 RepID=UPI0010FECA65|nr:type II secretion system protein [Haloimpatiens lingqiaonensis]